jgi:hypothetical protein
MENEKKSSMFGSFSKMVSNRRKKAIKSKKMDDRDEERSKSKFYKPLSAEERRARMEGIMERRAQKDKSESETSKARKRNMLQKWLKQ